MIIEADDRRVLGAIEFFSGPSGARIRRPLQLASGALELRRNASGLYVIWSASRLEMHASSFAAPPDSPAPESRVFEVDVADPQGAFAPRRLRLRLPRPLTVAEGSGSLLQAIRVALLPARTHALAPDWAVLRVRLLRENSSQPLRNALLLLDTGIEGTRATPATSDADGEAVLIVTGAAPVLPGEGGDAALSQEFAASLTVVLDDEVLNQDVPPDPDRIAQRRGTGASGVRVVAGLSALLSGGAERSTTFTLHLA